MVEKIDILIINKTIVTDQGTASISNWNSVDEYRWRLRKGLLELAKLEDHFRRYVPTVFRQLEEGSITQREAQRLVDTHCYNVFKGKPEQI